MLTSQEIQIVSLSKHDSLVLPDYSIYSLTTCLAVLTWFMVYVILIARRATGSRSGVSMIAYRHRTSWKNSRFPS
jgi:hypothetical protein